MPDPEKEFPVENGEGQAYGLGADLLAALDRTRDVDTDWFVDRGESDG